MKRINLSQRRLAALVLIVSGLSLTLIFQNCSNIGFGKSYADSKTSASGADSDGLFYTNQKFVPMAITGASRWMNEMRASTLKDMDSANIAWQPIASSILVDLGPDYASDGSKDGIKTVYIELRDSSTDERSPTTAQVFLDTQAPVLSAEALLKLGTQGKVFSKGQSFDISWTGADKVALSGQSSGISNQGLRWGYSNSGDCSEVNLTQKSDWMSYLNNLSLTWPSADPLQAFYICVYAKDRAGNVGTLLSQPMTSVWQVLAGENNQGNGGSVLAKNVRFSYPNSMAIDSKGTLFVNDSYSNVIRKISRDGVIELVAGNGMYGSLTEGPAAQTAIPGGGMMDVDSQDRLYILMGGYFARVTFPVDGSAPIIKNWASNRGVSAFAIDRKTDTMYLSSIKDATTTNSGSYIYQFAIKDIDSAYAQKSAPVFPDVLTSYRIAGNGLGLDSSTDYAKDVAATDTVDYPRYLELGDSGEIYYSDNGTSGYQLGHGQIRMLKKDSAGNWQNIFVTNAAGYNGVPKFMHYFDDAGKEQKYLLVSKQPLVSRINLLNAKFPLTTAALTKINPYPSATTVISAFIGKILPIADPLTKKVQGFVWSESTNSRLAVVDTNFKIQANYGRAVYDAADTIATEAVVSNPDGVAQAKNGDIYISEPLSNIVRKIDSAGTISLFAGNPLKQVRAPDASTSISSFTYSGLSSAYGFRFSLAYDPVLDRLYMADGGSNRIRGFDLKAGLVSSVGPASATGFTSDPDSWLTYSIAVPPASVSDRSYIAFLGNPYNPNQGAIAKSFPADGSATGSAILGTGKLGTLAEGAIATSTLLPAVSQSSTLDSKMNYYFNGGNGVWMADAKTKVVHRLTTVALNGLQVVEDSDVTHVFGTDGLGLEDIKIDSTGKVTMTKMCLPGTFLNRALQTTLSNDGNLLVADAHNNRVLKYYIRFQGALKVLDSNCTY